MEFLVWASLISSSLGRLHVFLPLLDRGFDALLHLLPSGGWAPVQVKGSSAVAAGRLWLRVRSPLPEGAWLIGCYLDGSALLGPFSLLLPGSAFASVAKPSSEGPVAVWDIDFPVAGPSDDLVSRFVVPTVSLGPRLLGSASVSVPALALPPVDVRSEGLLGELEVLRLLAVEPSLELYRPFPDLETAEIAVRSSASGGVLGLQVKTVSLSSDGRGMVMVKRRSFRPFPDVWVVCLAWLPSEGRFHPECLLLPSVLVPTVGYEDGEWWAIHFHPGSSAAGRTAAFRLPLASLAASILSRL